MKKLQVKAKKILVHRRGRLVAIEVSNRRYRNHKARCDCLGWWFPHRRHSRASPETLRTRGTFGCDHAPRPNIVYTQQGSSTEITFVDDCPF